MEIKIYINNRKDSDEKISAQTALPIFLDLLVTTTKTKCSILLYYEAIGSVYLLALGDLNINFPLPFVVRFVIFSSDILVFGN